MLRGAHGGFVSVDKSTLALWVKGLSQYTSDCFREAFDIDRQTADAQEHQLQVPFKASLAQMVYFVDAGGQTGTLDLLRGFRDARRHQKKPRGGSKPLVALITIDLKPERTAKQDHQRRATPRRALFDKGMELNLISDAARLDLNCSPQPCNDRVESIGQLIGTISLSWHFSSNIPKADAPSASHRATFHILPKESEVDFDYVLGRPWIEQNWNEFVALVEAHQRKEGSD